MFSFFVILGMFEMFFLIIFRVKLNFFWFKYEEKLVNRKVEIEYRCMFFLKKFFIFEIFLVLILRVEYVFCIIGYFVIC